MDGVKVKFKENYLTKKGNLLRFNIGENDIIIFARLDVFPMTLEQAQIGMKAASLVGVVIGLPTLFVAVLASAHGQGFWTLMYASFILVLVYFIYHKQSRVASITLLVVFSLGNLLAIPVMLKNPPKYWIVGVVYLLALIQGVRGAFTYHKLTGEIKDT